ncbi:hypothetical protein HMPREF2992_11070 [Prevotella sp. HMSC069G02]|nr:hypothetical protein HMPREF2992_11070 [Prevotella sp. HMSC069G02]
MGVALSLPFQCSTICEMKKTDVVPFLSAKVVRGLWLSQGLCRWFVWKISTPMGSIFRQNLVQASPRYLDFATKRNQHTPIFGRIKKMSLWISKK